MKAEFTRISNDKTNVKMYKLKKQVLIFGKCFFHHLFVTYLSQITDHYSKTFSCKTFVRNKVKDFSVIHKSLPYQDYTILISPLLFK